MADRDAGAVSVTPLSQPYNVSVTYSQQGSGWFGPLNPLKPTVPAEVAGRAWDFPPGYNLNVRPRAYEPLSFPDLRGLAETYDLLRLVLETRKDQLARMDWSIVPSDEQLVESDKPIPPALAAKAKARAAFFRRPDGQHGWADWLRMLLEDLFVIDAPALFAERKRGGGILNLRPIDGATLKRVIDDWGRTPQFPLPAFQQILHGQALDYTTRDIFYRPRNARVHRAYGMSPVEQIVMTVNIALRRQLFTLSFFTEGTIPESLIGVPDSWTPDQITAFQLSWDAMLEGNLAARRHAKFVPGGVAKTFIQTKDPELKGVFDEWLARVTCYAFSVSPEPFITRVNRSTAESSHDAALEEGLAPLQQWVKDWLDDIIQGPDGFNEPDLQFLWKDDREVDPTAQQTIITGYAKTGIMTINEARDKLGEDRVDDPAADMLMVETPTGYVPINANTIDGKEAMQDAFPPPPPPPQFVHPAVVVPGQPVPGAAEKPAQASGEDKGSDAPPVADTKPQEAGKFAKAPSVKASRQVKPVPYPRPSTVKAVTRIGTLWRKALARQKASAIATAKDILSATAKAADGSKQAAKIVRGADLTLSDEEAAAVQKALLTIAMESGSDALVSITTDEDGLVDQVNVRALAWAKAHAAELVTSIEQTTRDELLALIADGIDDNIGLDAITAAIADMGAFSTDRADLIAQTEIAGANSQGALDGYRVARDEAGVKVKKVWLLGPDPCEICQGNADDGSIDLDEAFSSGDTAPPGHPRCECALSPVVQE